MTSIEVPVMRKVGPSGPGAGGEVTEVAVWQDTCQAIDQGDAVASWLSSFLETVRRGAGRGMRGEVGGGVPPTADTYIAPSRLLFFWTRMVRVDIGREFCCCSCYAACNGSLDKKG